MRKLVQSGTNFTGNHEKAVAPPEEDLCSKSLTIVTCLSDENSFRLVHLRRIDHDAAYVAIASEYGVRSTFKTIA